MSRLVEELRRKYRTPQDALTALGLDAALLTQKETFVMPNIVLSRKAVMVQGALAVFLAPHLANDAKLDLSKALNGVTGRDFKSQKKAIATAVTALAKPSLKPGVKFAADASMEGLHALLDGLEPMNVAEGPDTDANSGLPMGEEEMRKKTMDVDPKMKLEELLRGKVDDATMAAVMALLGGGAPPAGDAETKTPVDANAETKAATDKAARDAELEAGRADMVSKPALDAALKVNTEATEKRIMQAQKDLREAEKFVKPWVGDVDIACDSAEAVHRAALKILGVDVDTDKVHPSAFPSIIRAQPLPGAKKKHGEGSRAPEMGMDEAQSADYAKRFPEAERIGVIG